MRCLCTRTFAVVRSRERRGLSAELLRAGRRRPRHAARRSDDSCSGPLPIRVHEGKRSMTYQGMTALITGASMGLGEAFASELAAKGANRGSDRFRHGLHQSSSVDSSRPAIRRCKAFGLRSRALPVGHSGVRQQKANSHSRCSESSALILCLLRYPFR